MTVEAFLLTLVALLREQRVGKLPLRLRQPQSALRLDERVAWLKRIREQLTATLEGSAQPLLLFIQLVDADAELCAFVTELAAGLHRTTLVLVADQPLAELPAEAAIEIAPFSLDDVSRFVRYEQLPLDQAAIDHLFKASYGLPRLLKRIVEGASGDMVQHDGTLQAAVMQIPLYRHIDEWGRAIVRRQPEGVRRLFELDAVLHAYSPDALPEDESFYESAIEAAGWVAPGAAAEVLAAYQNHPLHQYGSLTALLRRQALVQAQLRPTFPQLCLRIAHFYREQRPTDFYLVARYQSLAGQWQHAAATLAEIVPKPMYIYTARCGQLYALLVNIFERAIVYDELSLLELAGNCAAYLGQYSEAAGYYERLLAKLPADKNQRYLRLLARLLQVYEAAEDDTQARQTCKLLFRHAQLTDPLYALGRAYEGRARLLEAPAEATPILLEAIAILEQTRDRWGDEHLFYEEERLMFYDALAQAEAMQGRADAAIAHLQTMRPIAADLLNDPALVARIDNNLGYVYYYVRAHTKDPEFARVCFEDALRRRRKIGDRVGQIRTAQNLANLLSDLARNASDWEQAEAFFEEFEALADTKELAQIAQRELIIVNHLDALVDRGAFLKAKTLFENVRLDRVRSSNTRAFLFLNRAKLALWEEDAAACTEYLALASPLINDFEASMNKIEWAQLALECHLLLGTALEPIAEMWGAAVTVDIEDRPIDAAKCLYVQALLASSRAAQAESLRLFEQSRQLFSDAGYRYRAAVCALWEARIATQANDAAATKRCIELAETLLLPFGETPSLQRLRRLVLSHIREV